MFGPLPEPDVQGCSKSAPRMRHVACLYLSVDASILEADDVMHGRHFLLEGPSYRVPAAVRTTGMVAVGGKINTVGLLTAPHLSPSSQRGILASRGTIDKEDPAFVCVNRSWGRVHFHRRR